MQDITAERRPEQLPLHAKPVTASVDPAALLDLPAPQPVKDALRRELRWLSDPSLYEGLLARQKAPPRHCRCTLRADDIEILRGLERYEDIDPTAARSFCNAFTRKELAKLRRRHLLEPVLNDVMRREDFGAIELPHHPAIRKEIGHWHVQLDAASFFDQFQLSAAVRPFFCVRHGHETLAYRTLPMGFRASCSIAQKTMELICATPWPPGCRCFAYIDNVLITGPTPESVSALTATIIDRCHAAGVVLNESSLVPEHTTVFLGEEYDCTSPDPSQWTRQNSAKTVAKLTAARTVLLQSAARRPSCRQMAAIFGLLLFAERVTPTGLAAYFNALRYLRGLGVAACGRWNATAPSMSAAAHQELLAWLEAAHKNTPALLRPAHREPTITLYVDASAHGWGAQVLPATGPVRCIGGAWTPADWTRWNLSSSVASEPLGLRRAVLTACLPTDAVKVFTDHQPLAWAFASAYAKAFAYNEAILEIQRTLPGINVTVEWLPGTANIVADAVSRGQMAHAG